MSKLVLVMYYIWMFIMLITGLWLLIDVIKMLIMLMIDKIRNYKEYRRLKKEKKDLEKMNKMYGENPYEKMKENRETIDVIVNEL